METITLSWPKGKPKYQSFDDFGEDPCEELSVDTIEYRIQQLITSEPEMAFKFGKISRLAVSVTLENCLEQLLITKFLLNQIHRGSDDELFRYRPPISRFILSEKTKQRVREEEYEKIPFTDFQKLQSDICFICATVSEGSQEILETGLYTSVLAVILGVQQEEADSIEAETQRREKRAEMIGVKAIIDKEKKLYDGQLKEVEEQIQDLKITIEDVTVYGKQELRYVTDWENSRRFQNDYILSKKENEFTTTIKNHGIKIEHENRIHNEIQNFIEENMEDLRNSIQFWMQHYDDEIERREAEIMKLKMYWEELGENHLILIDTYEQHRIDMDNWLQFKEERRLREEYEQLCLWAAIKLQAWWRGVRVRRRLGPFKKIPLLKKDRKKKGKKK